jgi:hypothetical protein
MLDRDECVDIDIETPVLSETAKAILVDVEGEEVWIPKSMIHDDSEVFRQGHTGTLIVSRWIAEQKGLV